MGAKSFAVSLFVPEVQSDLEKYREASAKLRLVGILPARDKKRAKLEEMKVDIVADHKAEVSLRKIFKLIPRDPNTPIGYRFFQATVAEWEDRQHTPRTRRKKNQESPTMPRKQRPATPSKNEQKESAVAEAPGNPAAAPTEREKPAEPEADGKAIPPPNEQKETAKDEAPSNPIQPVDAGEEPEQTKPEVLAPKLADVSETPPGEPTTPGTATKQKKPSPKPDPNQPDLFG